MHGTAPGNERGTLPSGLVAADGESSGSRRLRQIELCLPRYIRLKGDNRAQGISGSRPVSLDTVTSQSGLFLTQVVKSCLVAARDLLAPSMSMRLLLDGQR